MPRVSRTARCSAGPDMAPDQRAAGTKSGCPSPASLFGRRERHFDSDDVAVVADRLDADLKIAAGDQQACGYLETRYAGRQVERQRLLRISRLVLELQDVLRSEEH